MEGASTRNPLNTSTDSGPMRLGDDEAVPTPNKKGKGKKDDDDDDGGWESTAHFMNDVFGEWLNEEDGKEMSFQDLMDWSEVRRAACSARGSHCAPACPT
eukprot:COSAG02_NODE_984_length_15467_cov_20.165799_7_plen_100_part_00